MHSHAYFLTVRSTLSVLVCSLFRCSGRKSDAEYVRLATVGGMRVDSLILSCYERGAVVVSFFDVSGKRLDRAGAVEADSFIWLAGGGSRGCQDLVILIRPLRGLLPAGQWPRRRCLPWR